MAKVVIDVTMNKLPAISSKLRPEAVKGVHAWGFRVEGKAKGRAKVDTGHMRNAVANRPNDNGTEIASPASYSGFLDMGTRYIPADRWFSGAVQEETPNLPRDIENAIKGAIG
jgi:hypothetical protein